VPAFDPFHVGSALTTDQNCAPVTITNGGNGLDAAKYPAPFVANVDAAPGCHTIEGTEVVFPNPGVNVHYGGKYAGKVPAGGAGITGTCNIVTSPQVPVSKDTPTSTSTSPAAGETLFTPSSSDVAAVPSAVKSSASSVAAAASSAIPAASSASASAPAVVSSIGYQHAADPASSIVAPSSAASVAAVAVPSVSAATAPKCRRKSSVNKRHERLVRRGGHGSHERLVRRRVHREMPAGRDSV